MKLNKDGTPRKAGSGRTKGAVSLVSISLDRLVKTFGPNDLIVVGRRWLEQAGIEGGALKALKAPLTDEEKAGIQIVEV
jgi:hypothetical protein